MYFYIKHSKKCTCFFQVFILSNTLRLTVKPLDGLIQLERKGTQQDTVTNLDIHELAHMNLMWPIVRQKITNNEHGHIKLGYRTNKRITLTQAWDKMVVGVHLFDDTNIILQKGFDFLGSELDEFEKHFSVMIQIIMEQLYIYV